MTGSLDDGFRPSINVQRLEASPLEPLRREMLRLAATGEEVLDLTGFRGPGPVTRPVAERLASAMRADPSPDRAAAGTLDLRAAVARHLSLRSDGRPVNADHVVAATTTHQALYAACFSLFGPGDRVLIPTPAWWGIAAAVRLARAMAVPVAGDPDWSLKVGPKELEGHTDIRTRGLVLCSPSEATGAVYTRSELAALLQWARERDLKVIADESLRMVHFGSGPAPSVLDLPDELLQRVVVIWTTGAVEANLGVTTLVAPTEIARVIGRFQAVAGGGAPVALQAAAAESLADERVAAEEARRVDAARRRRDLVVRRFRKALPGVEFVEPLGGYGLLFRVDGLFGERVWSGATFCERLLAETGVALTPGEVFDDPRWARLSYGAPERVLERAVERMAAFVAADRKEEA